MKGGWTVISATMQASSVSYKLRYQDLVSSRLRRTRVPSQNIGKIGFAPSKVVKEDNVNFIINFNERSPGRNAHVYSTANTHPST